MSKMGKAHYKTYDFETRDADVLRLYPTKEIGVMSLRLLRIMEGECETDDFSFHDDLLVAPGVCVTVLNKKGATTRTSIRGHLTVFTSSDGTVKEFMCFELRELKENDKINVLMPLSFDQNPEVE